MEPLDLIGTQDLLDEVQRRQDAKEVTFMYALASDNGESWEIGHNFDEEQVMDLCELLMDDESWEWVVED